MQIANFEPQKQIDLKYTIKEKLRSLSVAEYKETKDRLISKLQISKYQFYKILAIEFGGKSSASGDQLLIFAEELNCTIDDLINKSPQP
jgi:hypothetical protein